VSYPQLIAGERPAARGQQPTKVKVKVSITKGWMYRMRRLLATLCLVLLVVFLGYKAVCGANGMKVWQSKRAEVQRLQQEIARMKREQEQLQRRVNSLQRGDPGVIEREAREQLGYVKPGEVVLFEQKAKADAKTPAVADKNDLR